VAVVQVGKLLDSYLAEVASDANLKPAKFCELALSLPNHARIYDDGVYRAFKLDVLRIEDGAIAEITTFSSALFPHFGLPETLGA